VSTIQTDLDVRVILKWNVIMFWLSAIDWTENSALLKSVSPGTVSILASRHVRGAVGVEAVHSAVRDARNSALANGVFNVDFIAGLAEKVSHFSSCKLDNK
jgi:hypothetical protein